MDLVEEAGIDTADWANIKRGKKWAAANPKYCYELAVIQPGKVVVLNLWFDLMQEDGVPIFQAFNYRKRNQEVRRQVLTRANGKCESCGQPGFKMSDSRIYLETHHHSPVRRRRRHRT